MNDRENTSAGESGLIFRGLYLFFLKIRSYMDNVEILVAVTRYDTIG